MPLSSRQKFYLALETEGVPPDTTYRRPCPVCSGGDSGEKSFVVTVTSSTVKYHCFRASCEGASGIMARDGSRSPEITNTRKKEKPHKEFTGELVNPTGEQLLQFQKHYEIPFALLANNELRYCPDRGSFVHPLVNLHGGRIGLLERWYPKWQSDEELALKGTRPKAIMYPERGYDGPVYHVCGDYGWAEGFVLVEDCLSAIKVSQIRPALSLTGVHVPESLLYELLKSGVTDIVICLDPDAANKAFALRDKLSLYFETVRVVLLDDDPKDTPLKVLEEVLRE